MQAPIDRMQTLQVEKASDGDRIFTLLDTTCSTIIGIVDRVDDVFMHVYVAELWVHHLPFLTNHAAQWLASGAQQPFSVYASDAGFAHLIADSLRSIPLSAIFRVVGDVRSFKTSPDCRSRKCTPVFSSLVTSVLL